jgi:hypothetical protein
MALVRTDVSEECIVTIISVTAFFIVTAVNTSNLA